MQTIPYSLLIKKKELNNLFSALQCLEYIAGLRVNTSKTRLIAIRDLQNLEPWAADFGCATDSSPSMYPGLPLGANSILNPFGFLSLKGLMHNFLFRVRSLFQRVVS